jgi:hypothetical protein
MTFVLAAHITGLTDVTRVVHVVHVHVDNSPSPWVQYGIPASFSAVIALIAAYLGHRWAEAGQRRRDDRDVLRSERQQRVAANEALNRYRLALLNVVVAGMELLHDAAAPTARSLKVDIAAVGNAGIGTSTPFESVQIAIKAATDVDVVLKKFGAAARSTWPPGIEATLEKALSDLKRAEAEVEDQLKRGEHDLSLIDLKLIAPTAFRKGPTATTTVPFE